MIENIRKRFVLFNVLIIGVIVIIVGLFIILGTPSNHRPIRSYIVTFVGAMLLVFVGSWLLSKIAISPIQAAWQKQLDFTADASHELRTPITVIQTNLDLVLDSPHNDCGKPAEMAEKH